MTWRAQAHVSPAFDGIELIWGDVGRGRSDFVSEINARRTVMVTVEDGHDVPRLLLPGLMGREAVTALRDALDELLGKPRDDYRAKYEEARDALLTERARVDKVLEDRRA